MGVVTPESHTVYVSTLPLTHGVCRFVLRAPRVVGLPPWPGVAPSLCAGLSCPSPGAYRIIQKVARSK